MGDCAKHVQPSATGPQMQPRLEPAYTSDAEEALPSLRDLYNPNLLVPGMPAPYLQLEPVSLTAEEIKMYKASFERGPCIRAAHRTTGYIPRDDARNYWRFGTRYHGAGRLVYAHPKYRMRINSSINKL